VNVVEAVDSDVAVYLCSRHKPIALKSVLRHRKQKEISAKESKSIRK
jgi:hypothetical protein